VTEEKRELVAQFLAYETKRHREQMMVVLRRMHEEIHEALGDLEVGKIPCRMSGLANNLTDAFHRLGSLQQLEQFAGLTKDEPAPRPVVLPDRYRLKLTREAVDGVGQALQEWAQDNYRKLQLPMVGDLLQKMPAKIEGNELVCGYAGVSEIASILRAYANSPRGSVARRRGAKAVAERLLRAKQASNEAAEERK
jgi:hypothetical protein